MFDRFTDHAKKTMSLARQHAMRLGHDYIAPEHMLFGLLGLPSGSALAVLKQLGVDRDTLAKDIEQAMRPEPNPVTTGQLPFTHQAKKVLKHMLEEAMRLRHHDIRSAHVLLGLLLTDGTPAAAALAHANATLEAARSAFAAHLSGSSTPTDATKRRCLLISNSTMHGGGYLDHCAAEIRDFLLGSRKRVLFVPYALADHAAYAAKARAAFGALGHDLFSAHEDADPTLLLEHAEAVFVGGGNTFRLLDALYRTKLLTAIATRVFAGMPYIGSSAGTNVATLSIRTTNDMPIVQPPSFLAMRLVPFQINPHYLDPDPNSKHMGETREERLRQFHEEHDTPVLGMREGCMLRVEGEAMELRGTTNARLFRRGRPAEEFAPVCDLSFLVHG